MAKPSYIKTHATKVQLDLEASKKAVTDLGSQMEAVAYIAERHASGELTDEQGEAQLKTLADGGNTSARKLLDMIAASKTSTDPLLSSNVGDNDLADGVDVEAALPD